MNEATMTEATISTAVPAIRKTSDERKESLARTVASQVAAGARVESQSDFQAVLIKGGRVNHVLHLIATIVTAGLWIFVGFRRPCWAARSVPW